MKKLLSIILALTMIVSILPATFAGDAEEPVSVTFSFIKGGRSDVNQSSFETITKVDDATYTSAWTNYKDFPVNPASPNENWAYAGSTVSGAVNSGSFVNCSGYTGTGFVNTANQWIAFKVKVPKTATYRLADMQSYMYKNSTPSIEIYMFPFDERFVEGNAIYGKVNPPADPSNDKVYATRSDVTTFDKLGIANATCIAKGNEAASTAGYGTVILTEKADIQLTAGEEYILLFNNANNGKVITATSVTLTEITGNEDENVVTAPEFVFIKSALTDTSIAKIEKVTDSALIKSDVSTGAWKTHATLYVSNNAIQGSDTIFCGYPQNAEEGNITWVINAQVAKAGVYTPTISFIKQPYHGIVDFYSVPASYVASKGYTLTTLAEVKTIIEEATFADAPVGFITSVDMHTDTAETSSPVVGNSVYFAEDNYILARIRKGPNKSSNKNDYYYGSISSIKLNPADAALRLNISDVSFEPGASKTITPSVIDAKGNAVEISSITYESLTPSVAKVNASTGVVTGVADGNGKIKATATVGDKTITAELNVIIKKVWNPKFVFTSTAVKKGTPTGSTYPIQNVVELRDEISTGKWEYVNLINIDGQSLYGDGIQYRCLPTYFLDDGVNNNAIVVKLNFAETGTYLPTLAAMRRTYCGKNDIYLVSKSYADSKWKMTSDALSIPDVIADSGVTKIVSANLYKSDSTDSNPTTFGGEVVNVDENEAYAIIVLRNNDENIINDSDRRLWGYPQYLEMVRTGSVKLLADKTTLSKGDTTKLIATVKDNRDNAAEAEVTFESLNASVATVSGNTVTAVAPGVATIKATATIDGVTVSDTIEITVGEETVAKTVSIATSIDGAKADVKSYVRGAKVTVEAPEISGKTFRHWVRGTVENGDWVSADAKYSFTATTHTYLTAVYTNEVTGKLVEFFNGNGEYLSEAIADESNKVALPANPSITGYVFSKWLLDKDTEFTADTILTADVTRVVADFTDNNETYEVNGREYKYGEEVSFESDIDVVWYRNEKAVAYGKSYTYYVWDDAEIVCKEESGAPMVVLDNNVKEDNAYMIEYDACGKNIVEVGIIFGSGNHTVDSCDSKATSQRGLKRGQFTAKPGSGATSARGYLVYEEDGAYKVVYSK